MAHNDTVFAQVLKLVPRHEFESLARKHKSGRMSRSMTRWGQFVAMGMAQLTGRCSLRDIVSNLAAQSCKLYHLGVGVVTRSSLARVNAEKPWEMYEELHGRLLGRCQAKAPGHGYRFKAKLFSVDSTTIDLCLSAFPWAKFRRTKGAVKVHVGLDHEGYLPTFVRVTNGKTSDIEVKLPRFRGHLSSWGEKEYPRCRRRDRRMRRSSGNRWSTWFGPDVRRRTWLASSSRRPRRSGPGSRRRAEMRVSAATGCGRRSVTSCADCAGRTGACAKSERYWQKQRPGSRGRPDPGDLPGHERESGSFPRRHDGPSVRRLPERVLRVALSSAVGSGTGRCRAPGSRPGDSRPQSRDVWCSSDSRRADRGRCRGEPQAGRPG